MSDLVLLNILRPDLIVFHIFETALFDIILKVFDLFVGIAQLLFEWNIVVTGATRGVIVIDGGVLQLQLVIFFHSLGLN